MKTAAAAAVALLTLAPLLVAAGSDNKVSRAGLQCRCLPSDDCWPSASQWDSLNATVNGRLVATVPIGTPCHDPTFDDAACTALQAAWGSPITHIDSSSSIMQSFFANDSCSPFSDASKPCVLGNYVSYAVNVSSASDVAAAVSFANENNIRLIVRNTGHDYLGRSTGAGALAVWMHYLDDMEIVPYKNSAYCGPALKAGAGVLGSDAVVYANAQNLLVVTGECPSVGIAGAYTQGGGHSALSTTYGLAADQVLEFEVVTGSGSIVTASAGENADLFWALAGGGGGTFGVVTSVTVRAYPGGKVGGAMIQTAINFTTPENFEALVAQFHSMLPNITDLGASVSWILAPGELSIMPVTVVNSTADYVENVVLAPLLELMQELQIPAQINFTTLSYADHYAMYMGPLPTGHIPVNSEQYGSRLIPRSVVENNAAGFTAVVGNLSTNGVTVVGTAANFSAPKGVSNAVLPAWRDALIEMQLATPWVNNEWAQMLAAQQQMTNEFVPQVEAITPGSGVYMNEADFHQPNWQEEFYGINYAALLAIKERWDPLGVFYGLKNVGSDLWTVAEDGRLCLA